MDLKKFEAQIAKTGFVLEDAIARELKGSGWTVISNRFYVDDYEESVREIDLVAYRITRVQHFNVYTTLLISCKKSEQNAWAVLSRDLDINDPNADWWPFHFWTNDRALQFELTRAGVGRKYHEDLGSLGVKDPLRLPEVDVFAFQEMDRKTGAPHNDKPIFSAITSLMKAQAYEQTALPLRRKNPAIYLFHLLCVVDTDLVRMHFSERPVRASLIDSEHYIARYIIRKKETVSRIRFIAADHFSKCLADYEELHKANWNWASKRCDGFYTNALQDHERIAVFIEDFRRAVSWHLKHEIERGVGRSVDLKGLRIEWRESVDMPVLTGPFGNGIGKLLNSNPKCVESVAKELKRLFRYTGKFVFDEEDDIPF